MEADIGNPIEFDKELKMQDDQEPEQEYYHQQQQPMMYPQMMMYPQQPQKNNDIFANIDKSTWIIGFVVFLLGFFMGKTMQPVILRPG
jgi:hypothetical protein